MKASTVNKHFLSSYEAGNHEPCESDLDRSYRIFGFFELATVAEPRAEAQRASEVFSQQYYYCEANEASSMILPGTVIETDMYPTCFGNAITALDIPSWLRVIFRIQCHSMMPARQTMSCVWQRSRQVSPGRDRTIASKLRLSRLWASQKASRWSSQSSLQGRRTHRSTLMRGCCCSHLLFRVSMAKERAIDGRALEISTFSMGGRYIFEDCSPSSLHTLLHTRRVCDNCLTASTPQRAPHLHAHCCWLHATSGLRRASSTAISKASSSAIAPGAAATRVDGAAYPLTLLRDAHRARWLFDSRRHSDTAAGILPFHLCKYS